LDRNQAKGFAMAISQLYIPAFSIEDVLLDKDTGAPLSGGLVYFYQDNNRGILKPVYQITGTSPDYSFIQLPNPMTLSAIGTFEDSLDNPTVPYFYPYDSNGNPEYYYVVVTSSTGVEQFTRQSVPYIPDISGSASGGAGFENEISNPQFAEVLFDTTVASYIYNFSGVTSSQVIHLAPDWDLVVSAPGVATVTVKQVTPPGTSNIAGNPGTILDINSSGLSSLLLRQRIFGSPNLWGSANLASTFLAKTHAVTSSILTLFYKQSGGSAITLNQATLVGDGEYRTYPISTPIPASTSTDTFANGYIDIYFDIPLNTEIEISNVMVVPIGNAVLSNLTYNQESQNRQIDHLFHYYQVPINFKPIPSLLTGWDFPLNPKQFGSTGAMTGVWAYLWDQTIGARGSTAAVNYAANSITGGIQFTTTGAGPDAWLIAQYLTGAQAQKMLGTTLSVNMNAFKTSAGNAINFKIYLFRGSSAAVVPTLGLAIGTLASNGTFTKNDTVNQGENWTYIQRGNQSDDTGVAKGTLNVVATNDQLNGDLNDYGFNGWQITDATEIADTDKFCIIVTFAYTSNTTVATVNSISVVPGDIPTRPAPQTLNEVIFDCEYYYQKSFLFGVTPAQNVGSNSGESYVSQVVGATTSSFGPIISFATSMRAQPTITLYNPSAANAQIRDLATGTDWSASTTTNVSANGFVTTGTTPGGSGLRGRTPGGGISIVSDPTGRPDDRSGGR
jgi:hypothetical protein